MPAASDGGGLTAAVCCHIQSAQSRVLQRGFYVYQCLLNVLLFGNVAKSFRSFDSESMCCVSENAPNVLRAEHHQFFFYFILTFLTKVQMPECWGCFC